jgi:hypothetical protein
MKATATNTCIKNAVTPCMSYALLSELNALEQGANDATDGIKPTLAVRSLAALQVASEGLAFLSSEL